MGNVIKLDQHITNLIAAGEVIERGSSVVKELVENSIDAKATMINITLSDAGLKEIIVSDNGVGMDSYDARLALEPHATSKISKANDLFNISTLGFRGEALPSIISVSLFKMKTCCDGSRGVMLVLKGGEIISEAVVSHPKGTEISVKNLFYNTPARLQNLKSESSELGYIIDYVDKISLANPHIAFKLINNDKIVLQTYGRNNLLEVISGIYGIEIAKNMVEINNNNGYFHISGYVSNISTSRSTRNSINIIVNGRVVKNNNIINAVYDAYKTLLTLGRYPIAVININVDTSLVDVNVHPAKLEIRFSNEDGLIKLITETIMVALSRIDLSVDLSKDVEEQTEDDEELSNKENEEIGEDTLDNDYSYNDEDDLKNTIANEFTSYKPQNNYSFREPEVLKEEEIITEEIKKTPQIVKENYLQQEYLFTKKDEEEKRRGEFIPRLNYIGQLFGTYLLAQNEDYFYLIDQHAANERINYEKIIKSLKEENVVKYELLIPLKLVFTTSETLLIEEKMEQINKLGIILEDFGGGTYTVREIPYWIKKGREKDFIEEIIFQIINNKKQEKYEFLDSLAKSLACKKSVKGNDYLSKMEIDYILEELANCENPFTCPHGRPVIVKFTNYEIEKWFKRVI